MINSQRGFTVIEALISIVVLVIALLGLAGLQGNFARFSSDRKLINYLVDAASSALSECRSNPTTPNSLSYDYGGNLTVAVTLSNSCNPAVDSCNIVTATASARNKNISLITEVCNFQ